MNEPSRHSSLPDGDLERVERLRGHRDPDVVWLAERALELARLKVTDFYWPEFAGLRSANGCFAMRRDVGGRSPREQRLVARGEGTLGMPALKLKTECAVTDAFLVPRPYLIAADRRSLEILRGRGTLTVSAGGTSLFSGSAAEFLADQDGFGVSKIPSLLRYPRPWPDKPESGMAFAADGIFGTATLSKDLAEAYEVPFGVFLANSTDVVVSLYIKLEADESIDVAAGLLMDRYTTKGLPFTTSLPRVKRS